MIMMCPKCRTLYYEKQICLFPGCRREMVTDKEIKTVPFPLGQVMLPLMKEAIDQAIDQAIAKIMKPDTPFDPSI